jgi:hypothetical protein
VGICMYCKYDVVCALDSVATAPQNSEFGKDMSERQALGYSLTSLTTNVKSLRFHAIHSVVLQQVFTIPDAFWPSCETSKKKEKFPRMSKYEF